MNKIYPDAQAALSGLLKDGMMVMAGGFGLCGIPEHCIAALREGGAPRGFVAFTSLSEELAEASLVRLERDGPGAKVSRTEVFQILARIQGA